MWGRVSLDYKVDTLFKDTRMDLYDAEHTAMPFWIYFVQGNHEHPDNHLMVKFLEKCEQLHDVRLALNAVIKEKYGSVEGFFKALCKGAQKRILERACADPYKCILGPDGKDLVAEVRDFHEKIE